MATCVNKRCRSERGKGRDKDAHDCLEPLCLIDVAALERELVGPEARVCRRDEPLLDRRRLVERDGKAREAVVALRVCVGLGSVRVSALTRRNAGVPVKEARRTRWEVCNLPQARVVVLALLLVDRFVPPPDELDRDSPTRVDDLALNLVAPAQAAPRRALLEGDGCLRGRERRRDDQVADDLEVLGPRDEVAYE